MNMAPGHVLCKWQYINVEIFNILIVTLVTPMAVWH